MNEFTTVFLFTDIGDYQTRGASWALLFGSVPLVCVFFVLLLNSYPQLSNWIKEKVITTAWLSMASVRGALLVIALVWIIVIGRLNPAPTHPVLETFPPWAPGNQQYAKLQKIYNSHQYVVVEGTVHVLHTQRYEGHDEGDIIKIGNVEFRFSYYESTFGYAQTISHGGALTEGTYARVYYIENECSPDWSFARYTILRVDVKNK